MREVPIPPHITILFVEQEVLNCSPLPLLAWTDEEVRSSETTLSRSIQFSRPMYGATTC